MTGHEETGVVNVSVPYSWITRERIAIVLIATVAVAVRTFFFIQVKDNPFLNHPRLDALFHDEWALSIAGGNLFGNDVFFRAPFYPYFLAALYSIFGHDYLAVRITQHLIGALTAILVFRLSSTIFDKRTSLLAAFLVTLNPMLMYFEEQLLFESLLASLSLLWLVVTSNATEKDRKSSWLASGVLLGVLSITRPPFLVVGIVLVLFAIWRRPRATKSNLLLPFVLFLLGVATIVLPVTIRNYVVGKDLVLIASQGGVNFYIGNNPDADGMSSAMPRRLGSSWENRNETYLVEKELGHRPSPSEESTFWYGKAFDFIREQPVSFLQLLFKKMYLFWNHYEIPNNLDFNLFKKYSPFLEFNPFGFWITGPLALLGVFTSLWQPITKQNHFVVFLIVFIVLFFAATILFFVCDRYRVPLVPVLVIFASHGFFQLVDTVRQKLFSQLVPLVVALVCFSLFVNSTLYEIRSESPTRDLLTLGIIALSENRSTDAAQKFQEALDLNPFYPNLHHNMGVAIWMQGNVDAAINWFQRELSLNASSFPSLINLSQIHYERHENSLAESYARQAVESKPYLPSGYIWLAKSLLVQGNTVWAESILVRGSKMCPEREFVYGTYLLGNILNSKGNATEAEKLFRFAIQRLTDLGKGHQPLYEPEFGYTLEQKVGEALSVVKAKTYYGLADILLSRNAPDSASVYYTMATKLDTNFADAFAALGVANLRVGRLDDAQLALERALNLNPRMFLYWFNYGQVLHTAHKYGTAASAFEMSLKLNPDFEPTRAVLSSLNRLKKK